MYFRIKMKLHTLWQLKERNCSITQTITKASQACLVVPHSWRDTMVDLYANYYGKSNRTKKICTKSSFDIEEFHLTLSFCYPTLNTYMAREHYMIHSQWRPRILELLTKHTTFYSQHLMCICTLGSIHTYDKHLALITWLTIRITTTPTLAYDLNMPCVEKGGDIEACPRHAFKIHDKSITGSLEMQ